jgi:hypothetical protein
MFGNLLRDVLFQASSQLWLATLAVTQLGKLGIASSRYRSATWHYSMMLSQKPIKAAGLDKHQ